MSKKNNTKKIDLREVFSQNVTDVNIGELAEELSLVFAANVNILRHLAAANCGLKIGQLRLLYTLYKLKAFPDKTHFVKVSKSINDCCSTYHAHGDSGLKKMLSNNAVDWEMNCPIIHPSGNHGNASGDEPAAARYIEAKLSNYAYKCFFEDFNEDIMDMKPNYLGDTTEPDFILPSRYPNLLINGTFSIGAGISASIYPCNFNEVIELTLKLMKDPEGTDCTIYPDFPQGCSIIDEGQFSEICETGKGSFKLRGVSEINDNDNTVRVTATTPFYPINNIVSKILNDSHSEKAADIELQKLFDKYIDDVHDKSTTPSDVNKIFILKKEADPYRFIQLLYKKTGFQTSKHVDMTLVDNYLDLKFNIRSILLTWLMYRRDYKRRDCNNKLVKKYGRKHILETILFLFNGDNAEKSLKIMKGSKNRKEIQSKLMSTFGISSIQAEAISGMPMYKFSSDDKAKYKEELDNLNKKEIPKLEKILSSNKEIDKAIKAELLEGMELFGRPRRSQIITINNEQLIKKSNHTLVVTNEGYLKKLPAKITSIGKLKDNDIPTDIFRVSNATELLFFDEFGNITKMGVYDIPNATEKMVGHKISDLFKSIKGRIVSIEPVISDTIIKKMKDPYILFITKNGIFKKTPLTQYKNIKRDMIGINIKEGDSLEAVKIIDGKKDLLVYTAKGFGVRVSSEDISSTNRSSIGTKGILMDESDFIIGVDIIRKDDKSIFVLTSKGNAKLCNLKEFPVITDRNPLRIASLGDDETIVKIKTVKGSEEFKVVLKNTIEHLRLTDLQILPRMSKGKKHVPVRKGEVIISVQEIKDK